MGLFQFLLLVSVSLAALATDAVSGHQDIEVVNDSGGGIELFLVDRPGKLSRLQEQSPVDRNVKINNLMTGNELEIHEVCGTAATTEEKTCRKAFLKVPKETEETPGETFYPTFCWDTFLPHLEPHHHL
jgi:hypothetical protein